MKCHAEARADRIGDAAGGPEVGGKTVVGRLVGEPAEHLGLLLGGEEASAARVRLGGEGVGSGRTVDAHPFADGDAVDAEEIGDGGLGPAVEDLLDSEAAAGFHPGPSGGRFHDAEEDTIDRPTSARPATCGSVARDPCPARALIPASEHL